MKTGLVARGERAASAKPGSGAALLKLFSSPYNRTPASATVADIFAADGVRLRTAQWRQPSDSIGTVVVLGGRGEFIEKYFEVIGELLARGFAVAAMDWRGQGGSERLLHNPRKGHVGRFSDYELDLDALFGEMAKQGCPKPWIGLAHSMGATILLGAIGAGRCPLAGVVLTSPMIAIKGVKHRGRTKLAVEALCSLGLAGRFAPGGGPTSPWLSAFEGNVLTSDRTRHARISAFIEAHPELTLGGPTLGWARAAFRHVQRLEQSEWSRRRAPILIVAAGADRVVDTASAQRLALRAAVEQIVVIDGAEHEILMERDVLRSQFWSAFDQFVSGSISNISQARRS